MVPVVLLRRILQASRDRNKVVERRRIDAVDINRVASRDRIDTSY